MENELFWKIDDENLGNAILVMIENFFQKDSKLIKNQIHEQSITHRLAVYLELSFESNKLYNIDCEYNKKKYMVNKYFHIDTNDFLKNNVNIKDRQGTCNIIDFKEGDYYLCINGNNKVFIGKYNNNSISIQSQYMRPDIIVHSRGNNDKNLCLFELKKGKELDKKDIIKLRGFTKSNFGFNYQYGIGLYNFQENSVEIDLYMNGEKAGNFIYEHGKGITERS